MPSGKKTCPECQKELAARTKTCECGHIFTSASGTSKKKSKKKTPTPVSALIDVVLLLQKHNKDIRKYDTVEKWLSSVQVSTDNILTLKPKELENFQNKVKSAKALNSVPVSTIKTVWNKLNPEGE
jgi:hypothetical protein